MPKTAPYIPNEILENTTRDRIEKECPKCHSTMFQGPFNRGNIVNGAFEIRETLYNCVNCHAVLPISAMEDRVTLAAPL